MFYDKNRNSGVKLYKKDFLTNCDRKSLYMYELSQSQWSLSFEKIIINIQIHPEFSQRITVFGRDNEDKDKEKIVYRISTTQILNILTIAIQQIYVNKDIL